jgi:NAD-dependent dihydropyrimidine dehydrogenase PreA subunit
MPIKVNKNICDHADACPAAGACPTGALYWCKEKKEISEENSKCTDCEICINECPVGAIYFWKKGDMEAQARVEKEIADDKRTLEELLVDRYGAAPIDESILLDACDVDSAIASTKGVLLFELNREEDIRCLLHSIPVASIKSAIGKCSYHKVLLQERAGIQSFPAILVVVDGVAKGAVEGYFEEKEQGEFVAKIKKLVK